MFVNEILSSRWIGPIELSHHFGFFPSVSKGIFHLHFFGEKKSILVSNLSRFLALYSATFVALGSSLLEPRRKTLVGYIIITASRHLPGAALKRDFSFWVFFFFFKMDHYSALCTVFQKFDGIINWWCLLVSGPFFNQNILVPNFQIRRKYFSLSLLQFLCILAW